MNDSGERIQFGEGKAMREPSTGKGRYDLISPFMLEELAKWMEEGAIKYKDRNWEKGGIPFSRFTDSALRHLVKHIMGMEDENHLAGVMFNVMAMMHMRALGRLEDDDMPHYLTEDKKPPECHTEASSGYKKSCADAIAAIKSNYPSSGYSMLCEALDLAIVLLEKEIANG